MKGKLVLQDIVDMLAKKTSLSKKEADSFFRELFAVIIDNVFNNEPVKIKDFGSFKLTKVNSRESVNVNTGGKIEIPEHYKISFTPDKSLKELVNKPFAHFETTLLEEGVSFDIEESEELEVGQEEEDTSIDEVEVIRKEEAVAVLHPEEKEPEVPQEKRQEAVSSVVPATGAVVSEEKSKKEETRVQPTVLQSFVYTYISSTREEKNNTTITMVVPTGNFVSKPVTEQIVEKNYEIEEKPVSILQKPEDAVGQQGSEANESTPIEVNKVQEKIDLLKEAIGSLTKQKVQSEADEFSLDSKNDEEKVVEERNPVDSQETEATDTIFDESEQEFRSKELEQVVFQEGTAGFDKTSQEDVDSLSFSTKEKDGADELPEEEDSDEDYINDADYHDFYRETAFTRFRRKLPIVIILLILIGIGGYQFYKLFNVKYIDNYKGYHGFSTLPDTLADVESMFILADSAEILPDTMSAIGVDSAGMMEPVTPVSKGDSLLLQQSLENNINENDITDFQSNFDKIISENLKITVLEKAAYMQNRKNALEQGELESPSFVEVVASSATLLSIARKYYKDKAFWVYIYEENKDKIADYNNLPVGMKLVIPSPEKYGINPNDPQSLVKARALESSVLSLQKKK